MTSHRPVARNVEPAGDGTWRWELTVERESHGDPLIGGGTGAVRYVHATRLGSGLHGYCGVDGDVSLAEAIMTVPRPGRRLVDGLAVFAGDLLDGEALTPLSSVGADALEKCETLIRDGVGEGDPRQRILVEAVATARLPGARPDPGEGPAFGLGRLVPPRESGSPCVLVHPGTPAPAAAHLGRWVEELGIMALLFKDKLPAVSGRAHLLVSVLDRWAQARHEQVRLNALLALGAHIHRRLRAPSAPPETVTVMLEFAELIIEEPGAIGLSWTDAHAG